MPESLTIFVGVTVTQGTLSILPETQADMLTRDVVVPGFCFSDWGGRGARDRPGFEPETERGQRAPRDSVLLPLLHARFEFT